MTETHCPYCALQCGLDVGPGGGIEARDFPTNRGTLCRKGWTSGQLLSAPDRLASPMIRTERDGFREVSWEEALDYIAKRLQEIQRTHGRDSVALFGGGGLTNEKAYSLGKFARAVLRTPNIDYNGRFCMSSAAAAANRAFGLDRGLPFPVTDLQQADAVLLAGANPAETMPPFMQHLAHARQNDGLIVSDPRLSSTARQASLTLHPTPGTDLALALGMTQIAFAEGLADTGYLRARTTGWQDIAKRAASYWPERVERITGVPADDMREAVHTLANADSAYILTARGVEQHSNGTDSTSAYINLALVLGLPGKVGSGYGTLTGQGNGQGGREHGQKSDQLPGYRNITDEAARRHTASIWGIEPKDIPGPGMPAVEMLGQLAQAGGIRALLVHGSNPVVSSPNNSRLPEGLRALDLLVVADPFLSETAALADVVLPVTQWAEEDGTMTNLEGRVLLRRKASDPPPHVRSDLDVFAGLAARLAPEISMLDNPSSVFDELTRASTGGRADYSGLDYDRLAGDDALHWPVPDSSHAGTPRMFLDRFATEDGRAVLIDVDHSSVADDIGEDRTIYLTTGRVMEHFQSGTQTRRVPALLESQPEAYVEIHPDLADLRQIQSGDPVSITSSRGQVLARARVTESIRPDTVFVPFHYPNEGSVNGATNDASDPISGMPEFKACAVTVSRYDGAEMS